MASGPGGGGFRSGRRAESAWRQPLPGARAEADLWIERLMEMNPPCNSLPPPSPHVADTSLIIPVRAFGGGGGGWMGEGGTRLSLYRKGRAGSKNQVFCFLDQLNLL